MAQYTWTTVRIALWHRPNGDIASHTRIDLAGAVPDDEALAKARMLVTHDRAPADQRDYLLNCIDIGNYAIERTN